MEKVIMNFNMTAFRKAAVFLATPTLVLLLVVFLFFLDFELLKNFILSKELFPASLRVAVFALEIFLFYKLYIMYDKRFPVINTDNYTLIQRVDTFYSEDTEKKIMQCIKSNYNYTIGKQDLEILKTTVSGQFLLSFTKNIE